MFLCSSVIDLFWGSALKEILRLHSQTRYCLLSGKLIPKGAVFFFYYSPSSTQFSTSIPPVSSLFPFLYIYSFSRSRKQRWAFPSVCELPGHCTHYTVVVGTLLYRLNYRSPKLSGACFNPLTYAQPMWQLFLLKLTAIFNSHPGLTVQMFVTNFRSDMSSVSIKANQDCIVFPWHRE